MLTTKLTTKIQRYLRKREFPINCIPHLTLFIIIFRLSLLLSGIFMNRYIPKVGTWEDGLSGTKIPVTRAVLLPFEVTDHPVLFQMIESLGRIPENPLSPEQDIMNLPLSQKLVPCSWPNKCFTLFRRGQLKLTRDWDSESIDDGFNGNLCPDPLVRALKHSF